MYSDIWQDFRNEIVIKSTTFSIKIFDIFTLSKREMQVNICGDYRQLKNLANQRVLILLCYHIFPPI